MSKLSPILNFQTQNYAKSPGESIAIECWSFGFLRNWHILPGIGNSKRNHSWGVFDNSAWSFSCHKNMKTWTFCVVDSWHLTGGALFSSVSAVAFNCSDTVHLFDSSCSGWAKRKQAVVNQNSKWSEWWTKQFQLDSALAHQICDLLVTLIGETEDALIVLVTRCFEFNLKHLMWWVSMLFWSSLVT